MNKFAAQLLSGLLLSGVAAAAWAEECKFSSDRAADFPGPVKKVVIKAEAGSLKVHGDSGAGIKATGRACASSEGLLGKIALESRRENDTVYLTVVMGQGMTDMFQFGRYSSLDLDVLVPLGAELDVTDSSGDVELSDVGSTRIQDGAGDLLLKNVNGSLDIDDSAGEIRVISVAGTVRARDGSGGIDVQDVRGNVEILGDGSGNITIAKITGDAKVVNDSSGDIEVADVGGNFIVTAGSSGNILYQRVSGTVTIPAST